MIERSKFSLNRIIYPNLKLENFYKFTEDLGLNKIELRNDLSGGKIIDAYTPVSGDGSLSHFKNIYLPY